MEKLYHFIPNLEVGGAEKILLNWVANDANIYHIIFTFNGGELENLISNHAEVVYVNPLSFILNIKEVSKEGHINLICWMYHASVMAILSTLICRLNVNIICSLHHSAMNFNGLGLKSFISNRFLKYLSHLGFVKIIYCGNDSMTRHTQIGYSKKNSYVVYNPLGLKKHQSTNLDFDSSQESKLNLLFVGRWHYIKNIDGFLAFTKILSKFTNVEAIMIGKNLDSDNTELVNLMKKHELQSVVKLCGYKENLAEYYNRANFLVISSISESYSVVACEAIVNGCPVISNRVGDIAYIVGDSGLILDFGDLAELQRFSKLDLIRISLKLKKKIGSQGDALLCRHSFENFKKQITKILVH